MFITFEGIEGSGKTLQIRRVESHLVRKGIACLVTREPGGTEFGLALRQLLLRSGGIPREPRSELLLYLADRHQHLKEVICPALKRGITVLSDRYHDATRVYQGMARGIGLEVIDRLAQALEIPEPDHTLLLDLEAAEGLRRALSRNRASSLVHEEGRFEGENLSFHKTVREGYLELARKAPGRIHVVEASGTEDDVFSRIEPLLEEWFR